MINRWVARVFGFLLTILHLVVIVALVGTVALYYSDKSGDLRAQAMAHGLTTDLAFLAAALAAFLAYVLVVGCLATLISINQNLERLNAMLGGRLAARPAPEPARYDDRSIR